MKMEVDWTELPRELVEAISKKLKIYSDYLHFRTVCRNWRLSIPKTPNHLPPQLPWLMFPQPQSHQPHSAFYNLSANKVHFLNLPEASHRKRLCGSSHGWLIILDETPTILLLNPLTRVRIHLPLLSSFPTVVSFNYSNIGREYTLAYYMPETAGFHRYNHSLRQMRDSFIKKIALASSPGTGEKEHNFIAVAILNQTGDLAYCRYGDQSWTLIEGMQSYSEDVLFNKGSLYAVDKRGTLAVCDFATHNDNPRVSIIRMPPLFGGDVQYLVGSEDDLLLVTRYVGLECDFEQPHQPHWGYRTASFEVFKLNWSEPRWESMRSLGDKALFIGQNSSFALLASDFPGCVGDCIYYTDDYLESNNDDAYGVHDLGIFKLEDGSIEPLPCYPRNSHYRLQWPPALGVTPNPPLWVAPNPF